MTRLFRSVQTLTIRWAVPGDHANKDDTTRAGDDYGLWVAVWRRAEFGAGTRLDQLEEFAVQGGWLDW
jgi:hypothetical protein